MFRQRRQFTASCIFDIYIFSKTDFTSHLWDKLYIKLDIIKSTGSEYLVWIKVKLLNCIGQLLKNVFIANILILFKYLLQCNSASNLFGIYRSDIYYSRTVVIEEEPYTWSER